MVLPFLDRKVRIQAKISEKTVAKSRVRINENSASG